jgi:hypothetical protein
MSFFMAKGAFCVFHNGANQNPLLIKEMIIGCCQTQIFAMGAKRRVGGGAGGRDGFVLRVLHFTVELLFF